MPYGMAPQYAAAQQQHQMNMATMSNPTMNHQMMQQPLPPMQGTTMRQGMQTPMQNTMGNFNFNQPPPGNYGNQMGQFQPFF